MSSSSSSSSGRGKVIIPSHIDLDQLVYSSRKRNDNCLGFLYANECETVTTDSLKEEGESKSNKEQHMVSADDFIIPPSPPRRSLRSTLRKAIPVKKGGEQTEESKVMKPETYTHIETNIFVDRKRKELDMKKLANYKCECGPDSTCTDGCINAHTLTECLPELCGTSCRNMKIQRKENAQMVLTHMKEKGWGVIAAENLPAGSFLGEYRGEVINKTTCTKRLKKYATHPNHYIFSLNPEMSEFIDATKYGCIMRFFNHSCNPNCETQMWTVRGETCIAVFTLRDVKGGEELVYDYHFETLLGQKKKCHCKAPNCRGYL